MASISRYCQSYHLPKEAYQRFLDILPPKEIMVVGKFLIEAALKLAVAIEVEKSTGFFDEHVFDEYDFVVVSMTYHDRSTPKEEIEFRLEEVLYDVAEIFSRQYGIYRSRQDEQNSSPFLLDAFKVKGYHFTFSRFMVVFEERLT